MKEIREKKIQNEKRTNGEGGKEKKKKNMADCINIPE